MRHYIGAAFLLSAFTTVYCILTANVAGIGAGIMTLILFFGLLET
jgi:hypothetical protein